MKNYIEGCLKNYKSIFKNSADVVKHMFATLGNGVHLDHKGYIIGSQYHEDSVYDFKEPIPFKFIYPWSKNPDFQPFRELAGCRNISFKEAAQYFIDCIKVTPDDIDDIKDWKENIHIIEDVLLNTPTIQDEYPDIETGYELFKQKVSETFDIPKVYFLDVQYQECPESVEKGVRSIWDLYEFGNDHYFIKKKIDKDLFEDYPNIYFWMIYNGASENEEVVIHWWW